MVEAADEPGVVAELRRDDRDRSSLGRLPATHQLGAAGREPGVRVGEHDPTAEHDTGRV